MLELDSKNIGGTDSDWQESRRGRLRFHRPANILPLRTAFDEDHVFAVGAAVAVTQLGVFRCPLADFAPAPLVVLLPEAAS